MKAIDAEILGFEKRFGSLVALDHVDLKIHAGSFHALLGENGAGKSTLAKCLLGFYAADAGTVLIDGRERGLLTSSEAQSLGIGMVYQHFTLVPSMTVLENLVVARGNLSPVIDWKAERAQLDAFLETCPFRVPLDKPAASLSAGEKQKTEILKQLYLQRRLLLLDEPTSVLTPDEAAEVLGHLREETRARRLTVLMITHKLKEVSAFADTVSVMRRGRLLDSFPVSQTTPTQLATLMVGERAALPGAAARANPPAAQSATPRLLVEHLGADDDRGLAACRDVSFTVGASEILGVAGVSGNGQRELFEALIGQRARTSGRVVIDGTAFEPSRAATRRLGVFSLPEEPLANGAVRGLSVAENMALRDFDVPPMRGSLAVLRHREMAARARDWISAFRVKTASEDAPIESLSGGNVQRAILARELSHEARVLIAVNPVFGLDLAAVAEIHARLLDARARGAAVLLISEDLDELLELADRIVVFFNGRIVYETRAADATPAALGHYMVGQAVA